LKACPDAWDKVKDGNFATRKVVKMGLGIQTWVFGLILVMALTQLLTGISPRNLVGEKTTLSTKQRFGYVIYVTALVLMTAILLFPALR
jgi:hypothetical protein